MTPEVLTIGQVAGSAGVSRKAIRVWIDRGLLAACGHTSSGYMTTTDQATPARELRGGDGGPTPRYLRASLASGLLGGICCLGAVVATPPGSARPDH